MTESLSTEAAKTRLREVGQELDVAAWVRQWPFTTLLVAAVAGGVVARVPRNMLLTFLDVLLQLVLPEDGTKDNKTTRQRDPMTTRPEGSPVMVSLVVL